MPTMAPKNDRTSCVRAIIDTNLLVSGMFWHGAPHALLDQVRSGALTLVSSPALVAEFARVLSRPKFDVVLQRSQTSREQTLRELRDLVELMEPTPLAQPVCRDPDDDAVLALAVTAQAEVIVSGDSDLLVLQSFEGIQIVTAAQALQRLQALGR